MPNCRISGAVVLSLLLVSAGCGNSANQTTTQNTSPGQQNTTEQVTENSAGQSDGQPAAKTSADGKKQKKLTPEQQLTVAFQLHKQGRNRDAMVLVEPLLRFPEVAARSYALRGKILSMNNLPKNAISDFGKAIEHNPKEAEYYNTRGFLLMKTGQPVLAIEDFDQAIELKTDDPKYFNNRALAKIRLKQYEQAITDLTQAITINPQYIEAINNLGYAYSKNGQIDVAIENFTNAIRIDPEFTNAYNNRALARKQSGDLQGAINDLTRAIDLSPLNAGYYKHRAEFYQLLSDHESAQKDEQTAIWVTQIQVITKQLKQNPRSESLWLKRAELFLSQGNFESTLSDLDKIYQLNPKSWEAKLLQAQCMLQQDKPQMALELCNEILAAAQNRGEIQQVAFEATTGPETQVIDNAISLRADVFSQLQRYDEAISDYRAAGRFDLDVATAFWKRGLQKEQSGDSQGAEADKQQALQIDDRVAKIVSETVTQ